MKILLRILKLNHSSSSRTTFLSILKDTLHSMGHSVVEQFWRGRDPNPWIYLPQEERDMNADFIIYEHKSRHQTVNGDLFFMEMYRDGMFTIDTEGWGPHHSAIQSRPDLSNIDIDCAKAFCASVCNDFLTNGRSKHPQPPLQSIDSPYKPYIFVPLQLQKDDTIIYDSPLQIIEFVDLVCEWALRSGRKVVFKLHPFCNEETITSRLSQYAQKYQNIFLSSANIHNLIRESDGILLINSGVGFESLIHGKPVVTFGDCDYKWLTFRAYPDDIDAADHYIRNYTAAQQNEGYQFVFFYHYQHAINLHIEGNRLAARRIAKYLKTVLKDRS
ncbi:MAG: hypothetical protein AB1489_21260 [Acidobacteriota bacterium]